MDQTTDLSASPVAFGLNGRLAEIVDKMATLHGAPTPRGRDTFVRLLFASTESANLDHLSSDDLAAHAVAALRLIETKPVGAHKLAVTASTLATPDGQGPVSALSILNDDMPFLVDSVLAEIQSRGIDVHLVLHPIFKAERTAEGRLEAMATPGASSLPSGRQESFIFIQMSALEPAEERDLHAALDVILAQVRVAVADWRPMLDRVADARRHLATPPKNLAPDLAAEAVAFLDWLTDNHFTFLGARSYRLIGTAETGELEPVAGAGLGLLRDSSVQVLRRGTDLVAMTPEVRRFFFEANPLIITKANVVSRVHRRVHMDYIGVKTFDDSGRPHGELRLIGLFTSSAYTQSPGQIPVLRQKVMSVVAGLGAPRDSHAAKALVNILETFPRDELFQIAVPDLELWTAGILDLEARPRVRVFARIDRFDRFVSVLVFIPRDRFNTKIRERVGTMLAERFQGTISAFYPNFSDGPLVRVHFIVGRRQGITPVVSETELERAISEIVRTWDDQLLATIAETFPQSQRRQSLRLKYRDAFSAGYAETFPVARALEDIRRIERLGPDRPIAIDFYASGDHATPPGLGRVHAAIYRFDSPMRLSERVPVLENLGFSVVDERSYRVTPRYSDGRREVVLHDMALETLDGRPLEIGRDDVRLEDCFLAIARGATESDTFNRLVLAAGATWREAALLRAYTVYLRQLGSAFGLRYIADTLVRHAGVARDLIELFGIRFDPVRSGGIAERTEAEAPILQRIEGALANVESLDEDRILRQMLTLVRATVRTNYYQRDNAGEPPQTIAFKLMSRDLDMAPEPRPYREIWVWSPRVEGVHLRFAPIARGGIRWSDRAQDFRTEVLGLAKAQQVKNSVIVPAGAKGGFVPKLLPRAGSREDIQKEGIAAYSIFVSAMLDITDNIHDGVIVPPANVVRHDGDDPYLVVAADKGTATFSDTANGISAAHNFWLDDAFASGGSAGYDHKGIGITARGAWECVKRHFREMDRDIQAEPFTVAGVGDMSGDVFGNGMLLSRQTRLVAAFDHRDIFIDPDPDPSVSFAERKRLFDLPRSSWADYDRAKLSKGGGVFPRSAKAITLSEEAANLLGLETRTLTPTDLMRAVLMAPTDLLWFGGIGTYIRASTETDADAGDRSNDAIRITGADVRAKVVGEGANLGVTQRGRIEFATRGGRINTDFIDNSAGVNTSDQEVNIKIALGPAVRAGQLALDDRNRLLAHMTDSVAAAVLRNNYQQSLALSLAERRAPAELQAAAGLIRALTARGVLDRRLDALPPDREIDERQRTGRGLVRPEHAILLSYAKIALLHDLLASRVPDDPYLEGLLIDYFPPDLQNSWGDAIKAHQLRREIIATTLTNGLINRLGAPTPHRLADETARPIAEVAYAFMAARAVFGLAELWAAIDALDGKLSGAVQLGLYERVRDLAVHGTAAFLREGSAAVRLTETIAINSAGLTALGASLAEIVPPETRAVSERFEAGLIEDGVPAELAARIARLDLLKDAPLIVQTATESGAAIVPAATIYFAAGRRFGLDAIRARTDAIRTADDYDRLAVAGAEAAIDDARRAITRAALATGQKGVDALDAWAKERGSRVHQAAADLVRIADAGDLTLSRLTVAAARLTDLAKS